MLKITVNRTDDTTVTYRTRRQPWVYAKFLCIEQADNDRRVAYIPMADVTDFNVDEVATAAA